MDYSAIQKVVYTGESQLMAIWCYRLVLVLVLYELRSIGIRGHVSPKIVGTIVNDP